MREFFRIEQIGDMDVLNRVATVELVLRGGPWLLAAEPALPTAPVEVSRRAA